MEILLWLVPAGVVTVLAMLWVSWLGRERAEVDRDVAVARMGAALEREHPGRVAALPVQRARPQHGHRGAAYPSVRLTQRLPRAASDRPAATCSRMRGFAPCCRGPATP